MYSFDISIPKTLRDVKLGDWQDFVEIQEKNKEGEDVDRFIAVKALQIFCGVKLSDSYKIPLSSFDGIIEHIASILSSETPRVNTFKLKGTDGAVVEFGLIPNLDKMTYGEYQDLESYIHDYKTLHKAMAVLYRPLVWSSGDRYVVHPYKGTDELSHVMKEMPVDIALGAKVFFYRLATKLQSYTTDSLLQQVMETQEEERLERLSEKSGEFMSQS